MNLLLVCILILVSGNAILQYSSFRVATIAGLGVLWGGVMAGLILWITETTVNESTLWSISKILLLLESALILVGCFSESQNPHALSAQIFKHYPNIMFWWPLCMLAEQIVKQNPGVSFELLALSGGIGTAISTLGLSWGVKLLRIDRNIQDNLTYLINLSIILTIILSDGISL